MRALADALLLWLALQAPIRMLLDRLLKHRQAASTSIPTAPEEGTR